MNEDNLNKTAGSLFIVAALLVLGSQAALAITFGYPEVLGAPMQVVLERYHAAGAAMRWAWFAFAVGALLLVPVALLFRALLRTQASPFVDVATAFGCIAGFAYTIGIMRWVLLADMLSSQVVDPNATPAQKDAAVLVFSALDAYLGNSFGETIAPLAHGAWATMLGISLLRAMSCPRLCPRWLSWVQLICGLGIALRPFEYVGWKSIAEPSDLATGIWTVALVVLGTILVRRGRLLPT